MCLVKFFFFKTLGSPKSHCFSRINVWVALFLKAGKSVYVSQDDPEQPFSVPNEEKLKRSRTTYPRSHCWETWVIFFSSVDHVSKIRRTYI